MAECNKYSILFELDPEKIRKYKVDNQELGAVADLRVNSKKWGYLCRGFNQESGIVKLYPELKRIVSAGSNNPFCLAYFRASPLAQNWDINIEAQLVNYLGCYEESDSARIDVAFWPNEILINSFKILIEMYGKLSFEWFPNEKPPELLMFS